jgi:hypothetical protein
MYKYAEEVKQAEVRGCIAAWIDAGQIKVASEGAFEDLCGRVAANLSDDYDLQKVAAVTEAVLSGGMKKTASQETARNAALGELLLMKTAGQIDDDTFVKTANELMKLGYGTGDSFLDRFGVFGASTAEDKARVKAQKERQILNAVRNGGGNVSAEDAAAFAKKHQERMAKANGKAEAAFDSAFAAGQDANRAAQSRKVLKNRAIKGLKYGLGAAGIGGLGYLGTQLYNKYAE